MEGHPSVDLFQIRPTEVTDEVSLRLGLRYRRISDGRSSLMGYRVAHRVEILHTVHQHATTAFQKSSLSLITEGILLHELEQMTNYVDLQLSALLGRIIILPLEGKHWLNILSAIQPQDKEAATAIIQEITTVG